jgi:argininosuccinate lyase
MPGGYNRDLQESKALYMEGLRVTRASLRIMTLMAKSLGVNAERLRAGFTPGVFATDVALELVASGMPFRDAYQQVRANLEALASEDPDKAIAKKTHEGGTAGLDFTLYRARIRHARQWANIHLKKSTAAFKKLMSC